MTHAKALNYILAQGLIQAHKWRVDTGLGLVYGVRGEPFRRTNTDGYIQIKYRDPDDYRLTRTALAHRVIWESAHGPLDSALTINHMNGDKQDNRLSNLEVLTQIENVRHAEAAGLTPHAQGEDVHNARLTDGQVADIYRRAWSGKERQADIGSDYGVGREAVSNIKCGWAWVHVTGHEAGQQTNQTLTAA